MDPNLLLAIIAAVVFIISGFFQVKRMYKTKSAHDVSLWWTGLMALGILCTLLIVINTAGNIWLLCERSSGVFLSTLVFLIAVYYRIKNRKKK